MTPEAAIKAFVKERDEMLLAGDIDQLIAFYMKHNSGAEAWAFTSREVAEIALHKARTAATTLPIEARLMSKQWLSRRGYTSFDDGDLERGEQLL